MDTERALRILEALADGVDPFTGEVFPDDSPYQNPQVVRALSSAVEAVKRVRKIDSRKKSLPAKAGIPWSEEEDERLVEEFEAGKSIRELAEMHERSMGAIQARLVRLGKIEVLGGGLKHGSLSHEERKPDPQG